MRILLLRIVGLGVVVVLGWIAIAHAQRGNESTRPSLDEAAGNPLRPAAPPAAQPYPSSNQPASQAAGPSTSRPASDSFGLPSQRDNRTSTAATPPPPGRDSIPDASAIGLAGPPRNAADPASAPQRVVSASAEQPPNGPALTPKAASPSRSPAGRSATKSDQPASRAGDRYTRSPAAEAAEPAPLKIDPFATPATPVRASKADRSTLATSAQSLQPLESPADVDGVGQPGDRQLEGVQSPQLSIQKVVPKEIQVGKPTSFCVTIRNTGPAPASEVEIHDLVPKGTRLLGTAPQATRGQTGELIWKLGTIRSGEEVTVKTQLMPTAEGEIGSVATVHFGADASARAIATRPQLAIQAAGPQKVLIGDQANLTITVSNPGSGVATGVVLEEHIPPNFQHPAGAELEYSVGDLKPGESRKLELPLAAKRPGPATNLLSARGEGNLRAEHRFDLEVLAPLLDVALEGPKKRYLERQATYQVSVSNPGTAPAKQVELVASLPAGLKFVSANNAGYYEESTRTVRWRLEELPANETGSVELVTLPIEAGQHAIKLRGSAQKGLNVEKEQPVSIEGIAAILFQVADTVDPVELNGETAYEVHVVNQGSKEATNVRLAIDLPAELKPLAAEGPTRYAAEGSRVVFDGLARLAPKAETTYRVRVKATRAGDLRTRFQLMTDDMQSPVTKEESTRVYADE
jgi:uncharacterized repeat protein (TIGR01451 family)